MSSLLNKPDSSPDSDLSASVPYKQKNQIELLKLTPLQLRKRDALELAELIYKIYNKNCPVESNVSTGKENQNV